MKKIMFFALMSFVLISCGEKSFDENLQKSYEEMEKNILYSALVCDKVSSTWRTAIYDHKDHNGDYCSDFNDALRTLMRSYRNNGIIDSIQAHKDRMEKFASKLNNPPSSRKDCYNDYIAIVAEASSISRMATEPSGSLQSYNNQTNEAYENIRKMIDQFKIKYGEFLNKDE